MPVLLEIFGPEAGFQFVSDSDFQFVSDTDFTWESMLGTLLLSPENYAGDQYWSGDIINIDPITLRADNIYGGMIRMNGAGTVEIAMKAFDSVDWWITGISYSCRISHTIGLEYQAVLLVEGTIHLSGINPPLSYTFDIYPVNIDTKLLRTTTDYDGATVTVPIAFGTVSHEKMIRISDTGGGYQRYLTGGIVGTMHSDFHIYDDGVDVCAHSSGSADDILTYTVTPVGEMTISGTGEATTVSQAFSYLCGVTPEPFLGMFRTLGIGLVTDVIAVRPTISLWATEQMQVLEFLSKLAASIDNYAYIANNTMHLLGYRSTFNTELTYDVLTDTLSDTRYTMQPPISIARSKWMVNEAVEETIGFYVKRTEQEEAVTSIYVYGSDTTFDLYVGIPLGEGYWSVRQAINYRLTAKISFINTKVIVSLVVPFKSTLILPATKIKIYDYRYSSRLIYFEGFVIGLVFNPISKQTTIEAAGVFS